MNCAIFYSKIPQGFNRVVFHNSPVPWLVAAESASANETMFKVTDKKESRTVSVNANRVSL